MTEKNTNTQKEPETFRGGHTQHQSTVKQAKQFLNQTVVTQTRHQTKNTMSSPGIDVTSHHGIICPVSISDRTYKCDICNKLRVVCPYRKSATVQMFHVSNQYTSQNLIKEDVKKSYVYQQPLNNHMNIFQTPQFNNWNGQMKNLDVKFAHSMPYIPRPETSDRKNRRGIQLSYENRHGRSQNRTPIFTHSNHNQNKIQQESTKYNFTVGSQKKRIIQQIVYVPYIHNVIKPQFIINPQQKIDFNYYENNQSIHRTSQPKTSPIRISEYNEKGLMTPQNLRKLAQSMIR